jgi:hypothetical protein
MELWSDFRPLVADSHYFDESRFRIRIRIKVKSRIRIRIEVKRGTFMRDPQKRDADPQHWF